MRILLSLLLLFGAAAAEFQPRVVNTMAELLALQPTDSRPLVKVLGYYTPGDGGGGDYVITNSITGINSYGGRVLASGGSRSWDLIHDGIINVKQFGAKGYNWYCHPFYGISNTNVASPGTGDFSVSISFEAMASYDLLANGLFRLSDFNSTARSFEVYGINGTFQMLLRSTNGSSSVAAGAATISFATIPFTLGASNNVTVTRTGATWLVYVNGADVTSSAVIAGSGELSGNVTGGVAYPPEVGLTSNYQLHRRPIYWLRGWSRTLSPSEVASVTSVTDYTWQVSSQLQTSPDESSEAINAALAHAFVNNLGIVRVPAGKYRLNSTVYMRPATQLIGDGETDWTGTLQNNSNPSVFWAWDTSETNDVVSFDARYMTNQFVYLTARDGTFGTISNKVAQARVKNVGLSANYSRFGRCAVFNQVANASIEECQLSVLHGYVVDNYSGNETRIIRCSSQGVSLRNNGFRFLSVADSRIQDITYGGAYGPNILLQGANNNIIRGNLNFNAQNNSAAVKSPTLDTSTDVFTATGHNYFTGQSLFVKPGTGVLPTQLTTNGNFFCVRITEDTFKLSTLYTSNSVSMGALQGGSIDFTNAGTSGWTISAGPPGNIVIWNSDGNQLTGNRMDQSYEQNVIISGGGENLVTGNGLQMAGWANSVNTNIGAVLLTGETRGNLVANNFFGKTRVTSMARYGIELEGTSSNIIAPNINFDVIAFKNGDSGTGKYRLPWQTIRGDVMLGADPIQSTIASGGHMMIPEFGSKQFSAPTDVGAYPWKSALVFNTNSTQNTLMVYHPGLGVWRSIPTFDRLGGDVDATANVFRLFSRNSTFTMDLTGYSDTLAEGPGILTSRAGATDTFITYKAPVLSGMILGTYRASGYYATNSLSGAIAELRFTALENFSVSAQGTKADILVTPTGSTTRRSGVVVQPSATADDTDLLLWDVTAGTLKRVTRGAADSGGAGFRLLRVAN